MTYQPRDTRIDNGNAKPEGWISPEEQGRRDYERYLQRVVRERPDCACGHSWDEHPDTVDGPACVALGCTCTWWYEGRPDWDESFAADAIDRIRAAWREQCAGNRNLDACESCRAYADAIRSLGGEP